MTASADGSLLDRPTWGARHRRISQWAWLLTVFVAAWTIGEPRSPLEWVWPVLMLALMGLSAGSWPPRRVREATVAGALLAAQVYLNRYVGGVGAFAAIDIVVISFYQDWLIVALACLVALALVVLAGVDPTLTNGMTPDGHASALGAPLVRGIAISLAMLLSVAVWRSGTQHARDQLTGLLSRAGAERLLDGMMARGHAPSAWVCDIDGFRAINRELGSQAGDGVLRHAAARLNRVAASLPGHWLSARLGADTFLIATTDHRDDTFLEDFAYRIETDAGGLACGDNPHDVPMRFTVGAVSAEPGDDARGLIRAAELNMSAAKGRGARRVVIGRCSTRRPKPTGGLLTGELYRACENGELELFYQPIVSLADAKPVGAEALARWNHPLRGVLLPGAFLPEAEKDSALMAAVSAALFEQFLRTTLDLVDRRGSDWLPYGYAFNLSPIRLRDPSLVPALADKLTAVGKDDAERLITLEITEGALMDLDTDAAEILAGLQAHGCRIALDDFGIGHSSLAHLRSFPLDAVKIDKTFLHTIQDSPTDKAVIRAVHDIACARGLTVVAEGVETPAQRDHLLNVTPTILAQGWLYARAMPVAEFEAWVLQRQAIARSSSSWGLARAGA